MLAAMSAGVIFLAANASAKSFSMIMRPVGRRENDLLHGVGGLFGLAEMLPFARADFPVQRRALQAFAVAVRVNAAGDFQLQRRPRIKRLDQRIQFLPVLRGQFRAARRKILPAQFLAAAAKCRAQQGERRSGDFFQNVHDGARDHLADAEFRVVQAAFNRHIQHDFPVAVLQNGDRQPHRQMRGVRAVHFLAKRELVERDDIFRRQFLADEFIIEIQIQFALGDAVAGKFARSTGWPASDPRPSRRS